MSRITDLVDQAGSVDDAPPPRAPRAVLATDATDAETVWQALCAEGELDVVANAAPGGLTRVHVSMASLSDAAQTSEDASVMPSANAPGTRVGSYRGHPVYVPDLPAGRVLLHALRLLEEDPLADLDQPTRDTLACAALAHALAHEAQGTPYDQRLSFDAVDAFLADGPGDALNRVVAPAPAGLSTPEALLILDAARGAVAMARGGLPLVLVRAGRPALLAVTAGEHSASAALLATLLVATIDLGQALPGTLAGLGAGHPTLAMMLDERGAFQAASTPGSVVHVRGYERDEAS